MSQLIKALELVEYYLDGSNYTVDFAEFEERGITDIILSVSNLNNYAFTKNIVEQTLANMGNTDLNLHVRVYPFVDATNNLVEPSDQAALTNMETLVTKLVEETDLTGFQFNDFVNPKIPTPGTTQQQEDVVNYAETMKNAVHDTSPKCEFGINLINFTSSIANSTNVKLIGPYADAFYLESYKNNGVGDFYYNILRYWNINMKYDPTHPGDMESMDDSYLPWSLDMWLNEDNGFLAGKTPVIIKLSTYNSDSQPMPYRSQYHMQKDINQVIRACKKYPNAKGYGLYAYPLLNSDLVFPDDVLRPTISNRPDIIRYSPI